MLLFLQLFCRFRQKLRLFLITAGTQRLKFCLSKRIFSFQKCSHSLLLPKKLLKRFRQSIKRKRRIRTKRISKKKQNRQKSRNHRRVSKALTLRKIHLRKTLSLRFLMMTELSALCFLFQICFKPQTLQLQL